ncbi:RNA polymerase factor sigma-54 [Oenococcus sp.]|uniref:RNA polymerase factor sigma-54 n=1 Tax=Oenococcus sp. TaxID=1979414 RepID=UPI0039EA9BEB
MRQQNLSQRPQQRQGFTMTQQLQQSIQMLQLSNQELTSFLNDASNNNPFLDVKLPAWYQNSLDGLVSADNNSWIEAQADRDQSLDNYLLDQINLTMRDAPLRDWVIALVFQLDENGILPLSLSDIQRELAISKVQAMDALTLLQQLDPPGIGAQSLSQAMDLQIQRDPQAPKLAAVLMQDEPDLLKNQDLQLLADRHHSSTAQISEALHYLQRLSPAPGAFFNQPRTEVLLIPDIAIHLVADHPVVEILKVNQPELKFNESYFNRLQTSPNKDIDLDSYLKTQRQQYDWLTASLDQRQQTLLAVGQVLADKQLAFFTQDDHPIAPLLMREVAWQLHKSESTISRTIRLKALQTDFGIFPLRDFFTRRSFFETHSDQEIQTRLLKLIAQEDPKSPYSDSELTAILVKENMPISRRTVAKYRLQLKIPAARHRTLK